MSRKSSHYLKQQKYQENEILEHAAETLTSRCVKGNALCNPDATKEYIRFKLAHSEHEVFALLLLDSQHRVIEFQSQFKGTINSAIVYPREVVQSVLEANAAAVILVHNHPSGDPTPSQVDRNITRRLIEALAFVDVRVLDHIVVGYNSISFAERGMVMIHAHHGKISLLPELHQQLDKLFKRYTFPNGAKRLALNCRQLSYYHRRQGVHPIGVQFKRASSSKSWQIVFFTSFSYPFESAVNVKPELYFHLENGWCYQPDAGMTNLLHPEVNKLLHVWMKAFARHLSKQVFDDIQLSILRK
ncbi:DNA repair protein RadC [Vibrio harveyi]|nr:DNA repair protein RadC [Vibrio harveyi]